MSAVAWQCSVGLTLALVAMYAWLPQCGALVQVKCKTTDTTMTVMWRLDPSTAAEMPIIVVRLRPGETGKERTKELNASAMTTSFDNLLPYARYHAKISGKAERGQNESSLGEATCTTREGIPGKVEDLEASQVTSSSISLRWYPPARLNGKLQRYELSFKMTSELRFKTENVTNVQIYTLSGLCKSTEYEVRLAAVTGAGKGASVQRNIQTKQGPKVNSDASSKQPHQGNCTSAQFEALRSDLQNAVDAKTTMVLISKLKNLTSADQQVLADRDLQVALDVLSAIGQKFRSGSFNDTTQAHAEAISTTVVHIASNLLSDSALETWKGVSKDLRARGLADLIHAVENVSLATAAMRNSSLPFEVNTSRVVLVTRTVHSTDDMKQTQMLAPRGTRVISLGDIASKGEATHVSFGYFHRIGELLGSAYESSESQTELTSRDEDVAAEKSKGAISPWVVSVSTSELGTNKFELPIKLLVENPQGKHLANTSCVFWKIARNAGFWSSEGCKVHESNSSSTVCHCFHLTSFAVLMQYMPATPPPEHQRFLSWITYIGLGISVVALILALITFCSFRFLWSRRNFTHVNLVISMLLAELLFVAGIERTENQLGCTIIAAFLHYLFLAMFCWMAAEGIILYIMLVQVLPSGAGGPRKRILFACSWGFPALPVAISLALHRQGYGSESHCWLSVDDGFIWFFVGPVLCVCLVNLIFLVLVFKSMAGRKRMCPSAQAQSRPQIRYWAKACAVLMCLLGTTWLLGLFFVNLQSIAMAYLFNIFNSLQGIFIFVFHCLADERIRSEYARILCCGGNRRDQRRKVIGKERSVRDTLTTKTERKTAVSYGKGYTRDSVGGVYAEMKPIQVFDDPEGSPGPRSPAHQRRASQEKSEKGGKGPIYGIKVPRSLSELADRLMQHDEEEEESQVSEHYSENLSGSLFGRSPAETHSSPPYFIFDKSSHRGGTRDRTPSSPLEPHHHQRVRRDTELGGDGENLDEQTKLGCAKEELLSETEPAISLNGVDRDCAVSVASSDEELDSRPEDSVQPTGDRTIPLDDTEGEGRVEDDLSGTKNTCPPRARAADAAPIEQPRDTIKGANWRDNHGDGNDGSESPDEAERSGKEKQRGHGPLRCLWRVPSPMCFPKREELQSTTVRYLAGYPAQQKYTEAKPPQSAAGAASETSSSYKKRFPNAKVLLLEETPRNSLEARSAVASSESCSDLENSEEDSSSSDEAGVKEEKNDVQSLVQRFEAKGLIRKKRS